LPREHLHQHVANLVGRYGPEFFGAGRPRAELRLLKRHEYSHEAEVRLIYIEERDLAGEKLVGVPFEPNDIFEDITFDPRLVTFERNEREAVIRNLGYIGSISVSDLYERTILEISPKANPSTPDGS
jgi:hypothetical protein